MNEEKIKDLLDYLESLGFKNQEFREKIRIASISSNRPFDLEHSVDFGEELIKFRLEFWWDHQFNAFKLVRYRAAYKSSPAAEDVVREYGPLGKGIYHVNSVYHDISGRMDDLYERFQSMDLEPFTDIELYWELQQRLSLNPEKFEIKCSHNGPEGYIEYIIPVVKINGNYELTTYNAVLTPLPPIKHGIYNGIDTLALETLMREIDWNNDRKLFTLHEDSGPEFTPEVEEIQSQMFELSMVPSGAFIVDQLSLKYWGGTTFFEDQIEQSAWEYEKTLPKRTQNFPVSLKARAAFNALCGRAIFQTRVYPFYVEKPAWTRFDFSAIGPNGSYICEVIPGFEKENVRLELRNLPIPERQVEKIINGLLLGGQVKMTLPNGKKIYLEANPEEKTIKVYADNMKPIMVNLHFSPYWKPQQRKEFNEELLKRVPRKNQVIKVDPPGNKSKSQRRR